LKKTLWFVTLLLVLVLVSIVWAEEKITIRFVYCGTSEPEKAWSAEYKKDLEKRYPHISIEYIYIPWAEQEKKIAIMTQAGDYLYRFRMSPHFPLWVSLNH